MVACESRLGVLEERGSSDFRELMEMVDLAVRMGKPKAAYAEFYAESAADHG